MSVNSIAPTADTVVPKGSFEPETVDRERKEKKDLAPSPEELKKKEAHAEEVLDKIKTLTEDGLYSVRFEMDERVDQMIVRVVDKESDEVIRQVPAEEILGMMEAIREFRGQIVNSTT